MLHEMGGNRRAFEPKTQTFIPWEDVKRCRIYKVWAPGTLQGQRGALGRRGLVLTAVKLAEADSAARSVGRNTEVYAENRRDGVRPTDCASRGHFLVPATNSWTGAKDPNADSIKTPDAYAKASH